MCVFLASLFFEQPQMKRVCECVSVSSSLIVVASGSSLLGAIKKRSNLLWGEWKWNETIPPSFFSLKEKKKEKGKTWVCEKSCIFYVLCCVLLICFAVLWCCYCEFMCKKMSYKPLKKNTRTETIKKWGEKMKIMWCVCCYCFFYMIKKG